MILAAGVDESDPNPTMASYDQGFLFSGVMPVLADNTRFDDDIQFTHTSSGVDMTAYRLREGIERFFITDINNPAAGSVAQSSIPIMWDTFGMPEHGDATAGMVVFNHVPGGANVLYMDGHVGFITYPNQFPVVNDPQLIREVSHFGLR